MRRRPKALTDSMERSELERKGLLDLERALLGRPPSPADGDDGCSRRGSSLLPSIKGAVLSMAMTRSAPPVARIVVTFACASRTTNPSIVE